MNYTEWWFLHAIVETSSWNNIFQTLREKKVNQECPVEWEWNKDSDQSRETVCRIKRLFQKAF